MTMSDRRTIVLSAMMVTVGPISMALLTPAMPQMKVDFGTSDGAIAHTLTLYLLGFAMGQLIVGPLADRFGRRPIAVVFAAIYLAASLFALFAQSLETLLMTRLLQGIGVSSGMVISRAMVRDAYAGQNAVRLYSTIAICNAIVPMLSPGIGAVTTEYLGWHALFAGMVAAGVTLLIMILLFQRETLAPENRSLSIRPEQMLATYRMLLSDRAFLIPAATMGTAIGAIYIVSVLMPFILIGQIGLSSPMFGLIMGLQTLSYIVGATIYNRVHSRLSRPALLRVAFILFALALLMLSFLYRIAPLSVMSYIIPIMLWVAGNSFAIPGLTSSALEKFPDKAGAASALLGFIQIFFASFGTFSIGFIGLEPDSKMLIVFAFSAVAIALIHRSAR